MNPHMLFGILINASVKVKQFLFGGADLGMSAWVVLCSSLTLVIALLVTTYHYKNGVNEAEISFHTVNDQRFTFED